MLNNKGSFSIKIAVSVIISIIIGSLLIGFLGKTINNNFSVASAKITDLFENKNLNEVKSPQDLMVWNGEYRNGVLNGNGAFENPYIISNANEFSAFALSVENGDNYEGKYVLLKSDIYLNTGTFNTDLWNEWDPIGNVENDICFNGIFDGNNHSINGVYVRNVDSGGLFEIVGRLSKSKTVIKNLKINNSYLNTHSDSGTIASYIANCDIENVYINNIRINSQISGIFSTYAINVNFKNCNYNNILGAETKVVLSHNVTYS